jgi:hypothetical protein
MYLEWNLDMEEGADLYDPVGNIKILGDEGIIGEGRYYSLGRSAWEDQPFHYHVVKPLG